MTPPMQVKLLRVLQERVMRRVGGSDEEAVDVRIIAATNRDLAAMVEQGEFREDLYYRINVIPLHLPPLRERREDVPLLVDHFLGKYCRQLGIETRAISVPAMRAAEAYDWPGNVRELENVARARRGAVEQRGAQPRGPADPTCCAAPRRGRTATLPAEGMDLEAHLERVRASLMSQALERCDGVQTRAAELLGMSFRSFRYYAKKVGLTGDDDDGADSRGSGPRHRRPVEAVTGGAEEEPATGAGGRAEEHRRRHLLGGQREVHR